MVMHTGNGGPVNLKNEVHRQSPPRFETIEIGVWSLFDGPIYLLLPIYININIPITYYVFIYGGGSHPGPPGPQRIADSIAQGV